MTSVRKKSNLIEGPIFGRIFTYALPMMLTGILQLLYNAADTVVVGRFSENAEISLAAVGSTGSLTTLILNLILGLSAGSTVVVAQAYGAKNAREVERAVHTSIAISIIGGIVFALIGMIGARFFLGLTGVSDDVIGKATLYMRICFSGVPASIIYNFGSAILRATGDTKRPLIILSTTGIVNVVFNLIFVIVFRLDVAGVALATIIAQYLSAAVVLILLIRSNDCIKLSLKALRLDKSITVKIIRIGLPSGIQGCMFSISNVIIQSSVNTFPEHVVAGNTVGGNLEGFTYVAMNSFHHAALAFSGQNYGAKKYTRLNRILLFSLIQVIAVGFLFSFAELFFGENLVHLYNDEPQIVEAALNRMRIVLPLYCLCGAMEVLVGQLRGMGYSFVPMISSVLCACVFRSLWAIFVFGHFGTPFWLYISYPISWALTVILHGLTLTVVKIKLARRLKRESAFKEEVLYAQKLS